MMLVSIDVRNENVWQDLELEDLGGSLLFVLLQSIVDVQRSLCLENSNSARVRM
jgi:hypothetical protein